LKELPYTGGSVLWRMQNRSEAARFGKKIDNIVGKFYSIFMHTLRCIILLLSFALLIQNTCPLGAAGKSTVASSCDHCPLKHSLLIPFDGQTNLVSDSSSVHFPVYVFAVAKTVHTFQFGPIKFARPVLADRYKDALPEELLRPPRA
jgi:hypothetical protein